VKARTQASLPSTHACRPRQIIQAAESRRSSASIRLPWIGVWHSKATHLCTATNDQRYHVECAARQSRTDDSSRRKLPPDSPLRDSILDSGVGDFLPMVCLYLGPAFASRPTSAGLDGRDGQTGSKSNVRVLANLHLACYYHDLAEGRICVWRSVYSGDAWFLKHAGMVKSRTAASKSTYSFVFAKCGGPSTKSTLW